MDNEKLLALAERYGTPLYVFDAGTNILYIRTASVFSDIPK